MIWIPGVKHPYMIRKTDGGFGYATTDLAALRHRVQVAPPPPITSWVGMHPSSRHSSMDENGMHDLRCLVINTAAVCAACR